MIFTQFFLVSLFFVILPFEEETTLGMIIIVTTITSGFPLVIASLFCLEESRASLTAEVSFSHFPNCFRFYLKDVPQRIFRFALRLPRGAKFLARFGLHFLRLIHSDIRLLCGIDAAIGAGIGYLAHHPFVGMLAGGLLGVLNYEIVSKRLFKITPARQ